jgi:hypothetical protein
VLALFDGAPTAADAAFLRALAGAAAAVGDWDARVLVVVGRDPAGRPADGPADPGASADPAAGAFAALALTVPVLADPGGRLATAAGVVAPALVVADQWGEVHWAAAAGDAGAWPPVTEVEQWARYLAIRCAGVNGVAGPDRSGPGGAAIA